MSPSQELPSSFGYMYDEAIAEIAGPEPCEQIGPDGFAIAFLWLMCAVFLGVAVGALVAWNWPATWVLK